MTIRERLIGSWKLIVYTETPVDGGPEKRPLGDDPLGAIIYDPDGYIRPAVAVARSRA